MEAQKIDMEMLQANSFCGVVLSLYLSHVHAATCLYSGRPCKRHYPPAPPQEQRGLGELDLVGWLEYKYILEEARTKDL